MNTPKPKYSIWEAINVSLALGAKALEEIRNLARQPGPAGKDGMGLDDFNLEFDGERTCTFVFAQGEMRKAFTIKMPAMIFRGIWQEGKVYERGDTVTWAGSTWHCDRETTTAKPGDIGSTDEKAWTLTNKKGRDGKDAK